MVSESLGSLSCGFEQPTLSSFHSVHSYYYCSQWDSDSPPARSGTPLHSNGFFLDFSGTDEPAMDFLFQAPVLSVMSYALSSAPLTGKIFDTKTTFDFPYSCMSVDMVRMMEALSGYQKPLLTCIPLLRALEQLPCCLCSLLVHHCQGVRFTTYLSCHLCLRWIFGGQRLEARYIFRVAIRVVLPVTKVQAHLIPGSFLAVRLRYCHHFIARHAFFCSVTFGLFGWSSTLSSSRSLLQSHPTAFLYLP